MEEGSPHGVAPFVFSDPGGKRWPRLRLYFLIAGTLFLLGSVVFVQTLFVAPKMNAPGSLRQLKGQLKELEKVNPATNPPESVALWERFAASRRLVVARPVLTANTERAETAGNGRSVRC